MPICRHSAEWLTSQGSRKRGWGPARSGSEATVASCRAASSATGMPDKACYPTALGTPRGPVAFVLVRSAQLRDHAGELGFPGGKVEPGESLPGAALREVEEE